jgi:hypothetical protein
LHSYWAREEGATTRVFAQPPIIPGPSQTIWACDLWEVQITLGLRQGTLVHDVHLEADRSKDRRGACTA